MTRKALIIADSHGRFSDMIKIFRNEKPHYVIFAGDLADDAHTLESIEPEAAYFIVKGNCDYSDYNTSDKMMPQIEGRKWLIVHGHLHSVNWGLAELKQEAEEAEADIVIFGHTHQYYQKQIGNRLFFNPGALQDGKYAVFTFNGESIDIATKDIDNQYL